MNRQEEIINIIRVLKGEVRVLTERTRDRGTGHLYTALGVINKRIEELIEEVTAPYWKDEDGNIGRLPGQTKASHLRSIEGANKVRDAYLHSRKNRGSMTTANAESLGEQKDNYEHTEEYYDTERNRPMEGQNFQHMTSTDNDTWGGLSNRSMKQTHGRAVQTTSEMMQEELEPLPVNTFK